MDAPVTKAQVVANGIGLAVCLLVILGLYWLTQVVAPGIHRSYGVRFACVAVGFLCYRFIRDALLARADGNR